MNWFSPDELVALVSSLALTDVRVVPRIGSNRDGETFSMGHELRARFGDDSLRMTFDRVGVGAECLACWSFPDDDPRLAVWIVRREMRAPRARADRVATTCVAEFDRVFALECDPPSAGPSLIDRALAMRIVNPAAAFVLESFVAIRRGEDGVPGISGWIRTPARADEVVAGFALVLALRNRIVAAGVGENG
jgi:hypothetical protein